MEIRCPKCNRKVKLKDCICEQQGRKRIMLNFPCSHYAPLIYNLSCEVDNNTIMKDFKSISKEYFDKSYYFLHYGDRYLNI